MDGADDAERDAIGFLFDARQVFALIGHTGPWADAVTLAQLLAVLAQRHAPATAEEIDAATALVANLCRDLPTSEPERRNRLLLVDVPLLTAPIRAPILARSLTMTTVRIVRALRAPKRDDGELAAAAADARLVLGAYATTAALVASLSRVTDGKPAR